MILISIPLYHLQGGLGENALRNWCTSYKLKGRLERYFKFNKTSVPVDSAINLRKMSHKTLNHLLIALIVLSDFCLVATSIVVSYWLRFISGWFDIVAIHKGSPPPLEDYFRLIPLMGVIWFLTLKGLKLYRLERSVTAEAFFRLCKAGLLALIATLGAIFFIYHEAAYSRWVMLLASGLCLVWMFVCRFAIYRFRQAIQSQGVGVSRVAVMGWAPSVEKFIRCLKEREGYLFVGYICVPCTSHSAAPAPHSVIGRPEDVLQLIKNYRLEELFITEASFEAPDIGPKGRGLAHIRKILDVCEGSPIQINVLPALSGLHTARASVASFEGIPIIQLRDSPIQGWRGLVKRAIDIVFSAFALIVLSPFLLGIAILIRLTSPGKVIFRQERIGKAGKRFEIYKFRSMHVNAEAAVGHVWASPDDVRQTSLGKFLRRWSLDELPQFYNVLKGDMSLVGPRPEMSGLIDEFRGTVPHYLARQRVNCGMTGWAQVNGLRGNTSLEERICYDKYYIDNWSLGLDIKIILKTLWAIKKGSR